MDFRFAVRTEEDAAIMRKASSYLHDFQLRKRGKQRGRDWSKQYAWLDMDFLAVSAVCHMYYAQDRNGNEFNPVLVKPELFEGDVPDPLFMQPMHRIFDLKVICATEADAVEVREMSLYLDRWRVFMKGRGTKTIRSRACVGIRQANPDPTIDGALHALMDLFDNPQAVVIGDTQWQWG